MSLLKYISKILSKLNCKCRSKCCDCDFSITPAEYEEIIKEAFKMANQNKFLFKIINETDFI